MLFNSANFLFLFLPAVLLLLYVVGTLKKQALIPLLLFIASMVFYYQSNPLFVPILLVSISINYLLSRAIINSFLCRRNIWFYAALLFNITYLAVFKYLNIFGLHLFSLLGISWSPVAISAPLGISFYTFIQIAYMIDIYSGDDDEKNPLFYALFVSNFAYLTAGPLVRYCQIKETLKGKLLGILSSENLAKGLTLFAVGLFKKAVIAQSLSEIVNPVFSAAALQVKLIYWETWIAVILYSFQIYFDFSGYSDMALGIGLMIGISIPWNFDSPYRADNIVDFWRRWHITLSNWIKDYLFTPVNYTLTRFGLGLNINSSIVSNAAYYGATLSSMFICGLWHGASMTFVLWGVSHGVLISINRLWTEFKNRLKLHIKSRFSCVLAQIVTFLSVTMTWVLFRSDNMATAKSIFASLSGSNGLYVPGRLLAVLGPLRPLLQKSGFFDAGNTAKNNVLPTQFDTGYILILLFISAFIVWALPNTKDIFEINGSSQNARMPGKIFGIGEWTPSIKWSCISAVLIVTAVLYAGTISEFIYFKF